ncbi:MAG TPA: hypothetical protein VGB73_02035 [Pyrinomonadaceae bacterium]|jgi:hypothetical protein
MPETLTRRDKTKKFDKATGAAHIFQLRPFKGYVLEMEDVHFHHDSAVLLPDYEAKATAPDAPPHEDKITGLAVLRTCYQHAKAHPEQKILVAGHTDTSGSGDYNVPLSQMRADSVLFVLLGKRDEWVAVSKQKHKVEDYQQILKWVAETKGWGCHPGAVDNVSGAKTQAATREFQKTYNQVFSKSIGVDGVVGQQTWGAFFDVYIDALKEMLKTDDAGLAAFRQELRFIKDGQKDVGCGENFPIEARRFDNYRSEINRRVEILFFDPGEIPEMKCHPSAKTCVPKECELYNPKIYSFVHIPVLPVKKPEFQIKLELGDIDSLFPAIAAQTHTDAGVRQRLQAIGFLYEPLNSANIAQIAQDAWAHFKTVINQNDDAQAVARLQEMVKEIIVDQNKLPAADQFSRIRFPGTHCVTIAHDNANFFGNPAAAGAQSYHYRQETDIWTNNTSIGLIPIVAKVEIKQPDGTITPAPAGVKVHFQLITPGNPPAGPPTSPPVLRTATTSSTLSRTNPQPQVNMTGSPSLYVTNERARNPVVANDPQVDNAHQTVGGKRGNTVAGTDRFRNVLEITTAHAGFHDKFSFNTAAASTHPNAVAVDTNAKGESALILMPARTGGDRYKIRAFLDPANGKASDGTEAHAVKDETGTFVVWRILRFSKYMRWDYPAGTTDAQKSACRGNLNDFDVAGIFAEEFGKAWMDVTVEPLGGAPQLITQAEWASALQFAKARANPTTTQRYDLNALLPDNAGGGANNPSPGLMNFVAPAAYDAAAKGPPPPGGWLSATADPNFWANMSRIFHAVKDEIMQFFTRNAISGVTIIQSPVMASYSVAGPAGVPPRPALPWRNSGWGTSRRGCYVVFGHLSYVGDPAAVPPVNPTMPYDHHRNSLHEVGHVLYGVHQYTDVAQVNVTTGGVIDEHDYHDLCVMGYMICSGGFCGRCVLNQAGWNTRAFPANNPGP